MLDLRSSNPILHIATKTFNNKIGFVDIFNRILTF